MILERLLEQMPVATFIQDYYLKLPFARPGGCRNLAPLGSWQAVERLLAQPGVDVLVGREGRRWEGTGPPSPAEARGLVAEGYTVGIRHADKHDAQLADLAAQFHTAFLAPIDVHLYCTPAGEPGFGWHYDAEEVFILQTVGAKQWWLRKNTVHPWPLVETIPLDQRYEREIMPIMRCHLTAGDWLYIPSGYWHRTQAGAESVSLSVGVRSPSAMDVYEFLRPRLLESLRWRQRLPPRGVASPLTDEERVRHYQTLFRELGDDLAKLVSQEEFVRAFLAHNSTRSPGGT